MSLLRSLALVVLLGTSAVAEVNSLNANAMPTMAAAGASVTASAPLPVVPLSTARRPFALALGITLVVVTFHQAFLRRQRA